MKTPRYRRLGFLPARCKRMVYNLVSDFRNNRIHERYRFVRIGKELKDKEILNIASDTESLSSAAHDLGALKAAGIELFPPDSPEDDALNALEKHLFDCIDEISDHNYDVIYYQANFKHNLNYSNVFEKLHHLLKNDGLLVVECDWLIKKAKSKVKDFEQFRSLPTKDIVINKYLESYAVRVVNTDANHAHKLVRHVALICHKRKPIVIIIRGQSGDGKTVLGDELSKLDCQLIKTDSIVRRICRSDQFSYKVEGLIKEKHYQYNRNIGRVIDDVDHNPELVKELAEIIFNQVDLKKRIVVIEGYALTENVMEVLGAKLDKVSITWDVKRFR